MSKILITRPDGTRYVVSDSVFALIDWGNNVNDVVQFNTEDGGFISINWSEVRGIITEGLALSPGPHAGYRLRIPDVVDDHITQTARDTLVAVLTGPGSEDQIVQVEVESGEIVNFPTKKVRLIEITPETLDVPTP